MELVPLPRYQQHRPCAAGGARAPTPAVPEPDGLWPTACARNATAEHEAAHREHIPSPRVSQMVHAIEGAAAWRAYGLLKGCTGTEMPWWHEFTLRAYYGGPKNFGKETDR